MRNLPTNCFPFQTIHLKLAFKNPALTLVQFLINIKDSFIGYSPDSLGEFLTQTTILTMHFCPHIASNAHCLFIVLKCILSQLCPKLLFKFHH